MTRISGRRKHYIKKQELMRATKWKLWDIIAETVDEILGDKINNEFFNEFVEVKNFELGESVNFELGEFVYDNSRKYAINNEKCVGKKYCKR